MKRDRTQVHTTVLAGAGTGFQRSEAQARANNNNNNNNNNNKNNNNNNKNNNNDDDDDDGHDRRPRKRHKTSNARTIAVKSVTETPFKTGLLDTGGFVDSREFEIRSLSDSMRQSRLANNKRAFQIVPRDMRRRTASHNAKRVPKRLRGRASQEMRDDQTPTVIPRRRKPTSHLRLRRENAKRLQGLSSRAKKDRIGIKGNAEKAEPSVNTMQATPITNDKFKRRQRSKTWLPTHVWTAKRAFMENLWHFSLAQTPTLKSYRPIHRAAFRGGCFAWDTSFYSTVMIEGEEQAIKRVLQNVLPPKDMSMIGKSILEGRRTCQSWFYEKKKWPLGAICPTTLFWCPKEATNSINARLPLHSNKRRFVAHLHPAAFPQVWSILLESCLTQEPGCTLTDLRYEIGSIKICGLSSRSVLISLLQPVGESKGDQIYALHMDIEAQRHCLALDVGDPRLRMHTTSNDNSANNFGRGWRTDHDLGVGLGTKSSDPSSTSLFDVKHRHASVKSMLSQKKVFARKASALPGKNPIPLSSDPQIPLFLIPTLDKTSSEILVSNNAPENSTWTILLPWEWVLPFWITLMHTPGVSFGGLKEIDQVSFERGEGNFPCDFIGTKAGRAEASRINTLARRVWESKGKSKRPAWESLSLGPGRVGEVGGPGWCFDWRSVLNTSITDACLPGDALKSIESERPSSTTHSEDVHCDIPDEVWQVAPTLLPLLLRSSKDLQSNLMSTAIFTVYVRVHNRGHIRRNARIYHVPQILHEEVASWHDRKRTKWSATSDHVKKGRNSGPALVQQPAKRSIYPDVPDESYLIGHITRGGFSLSEGKSVGIGALLWPKVFRNHEVARVKETKSDVFEGWCIVRNAGESLGRLAKWRAIS